MHSLWCARIINLIRRNILVDCDNLITAWPECQIFVGFSKSALERTARVVAETSTDVRTGKDVALERAVRHQPQYRRAGLQRLGAALNDFLG